MKNLANKWWKWIVRLFWAIPLNNTNNNLDGSGRCHSVVIVLLLANTLADLFNFLSSILHLLLGTATFNIYCESVVNTRGYLIYSKFIIATMKISIGASETNYSKTHTFVTQRKFQLIWFFFKVFYLNFK